MSTVISFPSNPVVGQVYVADNAVTYTWLGNRWSNFQAVATGYAIYTLDGGYSNATFTTSTDVLIDGGSAIS